MRRGVVIAASAFLGACGLVLGIEDRSVDRSSPRSDASTSGEPDVLAQGEAGPRTDGASRDPCASRTPAPAVCHGFESGKPADGWDEERVISPAGFSIVDDPTRGSVLALKLPSGGEYSACLARALEGKRRKVTVDFDVRVSREGSAAESLDLIRIGDDQRSQSNVAVEVDAAGRLAIDEDDEDNKSKTTLLDATLAQTWTHVSIVYTVGATDTEVRISLNGTPLKLARTGSGPFTRAKLDLQLGDCGAGSNVNWEVLYDDFVVTTE